MIALYMTGDIVAQDFASTKEQLSRKFRAARIWLQREGYGIVQSWNGGFYRRVWDRASSSFDTSHDAQRSSAMMSIAENWFHDGGTAEFVVRVILAPDTILLLFIDGSSIVESTRFTTVYETCWQ